MTQNCHTFRAGPLTFRLDSDPEFVRNICFKGHGVLRGTYSVVRDRDWATLKAIVQPVTIKSSPTFIQLSASARVVGTEMDLARAAETEADVLHPAEVASVPCIVEHTDGSSEAGWFPNEISPPQPFQKYPGDQPNQSSSVWNKS